MDGNICRCTGYRPLVDTLMSFCDDGHVVDDVGKGAAFENSKCGDYDHSTHDPCNKPCKKKGKCEKKGSGAAETAGKWSSHSVPGLVWLKANTLADALRMKEESSNSYYVYSNTAYGVYKDQYPARDRTYVEISAVAELRGGVHVEQGELRIGAGTTISDLLSFVDSEGNAKGEGNLLFHELAGAARRVANFHVRNAGSVGGNLMMARDRIFLSDLATFFLGANASVVLAKAGEITMEKFLSDAAAMSSHDLLLSIRVPACNDLIRFYKTALRSRNSHAVVNVCVQGSAVPVDGIQTLKSFRFAINSGHEQLPARLSSHMVKEMVGKPLNMRTLADGLRALKSEFDDWTKQDEAKGGKKEGEPLPPLAKDKLAYRRSLAETFLVKFYAELLQRSGVACSLSEDPPTREPQMKPELKSQQRFKFSDEHAPVSKPVNKVTAKIQANGEAQYVDDLPLPQFTAYANIVKASIPKGGVKSVCDNFAREVLGDNYVGMITAEDVIGDNNISLFDNVPFLCPYGEDKKGVSYHGQAVAVAVACTPEAALLATELIDVIYSVPDTPPILSLDEARRRPKESAVDMVEAAKSFMLPLSAIIGDFDKAAEGSVNRVRGEMTMASQVHFYMEPISVLAIPAEEAFTVHVPTQWVDGLHGAVSKALKMPMHHVRIISKRLGGAFGGKIAGPSAGACMAAICAQKFKRAVRLTMTRSEDMNLQGGREEVCKR